MLGFGASLDELKSKIYNIRLELERLSPETSLPQLINTTNMIRLNEYLTKTDECKSRLIAAYDEYTKKLEEITATLFSIQSDLKEIVKAEASILQKSTRKKPKATGKKRRLK